jgi:hypothetical protein
MDDRLDPDPGSPGSQLDDVWIGELVRWFVCRWNLGDGNGDSATNICVGWIVP